MPYIENFADALPDAARVAEEKSRLEAAGVKYILSCWIDLLGVPKTKPVPISDFDLLCMGKGPQFAVHSISFVPELGPADSDQIPLPDLDSLMICPYDVEYSIDSMGFLGEMIDIIEGLGWNLHDVVCEGGYSQFELDFHYTDLLAMADRLVFLRVLLKEITKRHGMFATFMPKPTIGDWRSGAHMNTSMQLVDKPGENIFEGSNGNWSDSVFGAVGGLLRHGGALTAIACSTVNSYNGLVPRVGGFEGGTVTWAPTHMTYGYNNRSAMLRLPQSRFCIENRAADMCMNSYLALGMSAAAMTEGIVNNYDAGNPLNQDLYSMSEDEIERSGAQRLPRNLLEALEILRTDDLARTVLGDDMMNSYLTYKSDEWERYHQAITDWEVNEYLRLY